MGPVLPLGLLLVVFCLQARINHQNVKPNAAERSSHHSWQDLIMQAVPLSLRTLQKLFVPLAVEWLGDQNANLGQIALKPLLPTKPEKARFCCLAVVPVQRHHQLARLG